MVENIYFESMTNLQDLKPCVLLTTGRTGSDFIQSLMDSHTEILTFNGILFFHDYWNDSKCNKTTPINLNDLLDEFIGKNIEKFKSKYDFIERKDALGDDGNQSIDINLKVFKQSVHGLLENFEITSKNFMLAIYGAYAICLGQDITKKSIFVHHLHHASLLPEYLSDFPDSMIIGMTRDPRANFVSGILHHRKYNKASDDAAHLYFYINRIILDSYSFSHLSNKSITIRIEDLGDKCILQSLCNWLGVSYEKSLEYSTWGGLRWRGDRLSNNSSKTSGFSKKMLENSWDNELSPLDLYLFNFLLNDRLKHYGYQHNKTHFYDYFFIIFVILMPLRFELRFFSFQYLKEKANKNDFKVLILNFIYYPLRVLSLYRVYFKKLYGFKFKSDFLACKK